MVPKTKLYNPYYYVNSGFIFKISNNLDDANDSCAKHYVTFEVEEKEVKKGDVYVNVNGDYVKATSDGTVEVSTGVVDKTACASVFPYFLITEGTGANAEKYYYWLDNFINDGDALSSGKFMKRIHGAATEETKDFAVYYFETVKNEIAEALIEGKKFDDIKKKYPAYLFVAAGEEIVVDGKPVTVNKVFASGNLGTTTLPLITEANLETVIIKLVNEKTIECANSMLNNVGKEVDPGTTANPTKLITSDNIRNLS